VWGVNGAVPRQLAAPLPVNVWEAVLTAASLVGGAAGIWYLAREFRAIKWSRPVFRRRPAGVAPGRAERELPFPLAVVEAVERCMPDWRLPDVRDLHGDWGEYLDFATLSPLLCTGDFTGSGMTEYAVFVLGKDERPSYKVLALTSAKGDLVAHELLTGEHSPQNMFVKTMDRGYYRRSELVRGDGEPSVVHLKRQGISLGTFESAASLVFWDGQRFKQVWMSD